MANVIKFKRGAKASLPTLAQGEPGFCTDTYELYIGDGTNNHRMGPSDENFTTALKNKLDGIESGADVTDVDNVTNALGSINVNAHADISSPGADIEDAVSKRHTQGTDTTLGTMTADVNMGNHKVTNLADPTAAQDAATKTYVDDLIGSGLHWLEAVLDKDLTSPPDSPSTGDRYWIGGTGSGDWTGHDYEVAEWNGSAWEFTSTSEGDCAYVDDENLYYFYDGTTLKKLASAMGAHGSSHAGNGSDAIPVATTSVAGLMSSSDKSKLDGIESGADVTDSANVDAAGAVMESDFNAQTVLAAISDNTPTPITIGEGNLLGRKSGGNVAALNGADVMGILSGQAAADFSMNSHKITNLANPASAQDAATKSYVDSQVAGKDTFVELTDTPSSLTGSGTYIVRVNSGETALEFVSFASTYLESSPTNGETNKAPNSDWAYDHNAAASGVHGAGSNSLLHSGSTIDGGTW